MGRNKDGSYTGQDLQDYKDAWNRQNGVNGEHAGIQVVQSGPGVVQSGGYGGAGINPGVMGDLFGGGGGAGGAGGYGYSSAFTNTAQRNPDLDYAINGLKERLGADTTGRAIDVAGGRLRDLGEGQKSAAATSRSARGVSGTGVDAYDANRIDAGTQRAVAGAATDISLGREAQKDSILGQIAGVGASQAGINQADRNLAVQQWQTDQANQRAREAAAAARQASIMSMLFAA